MKLKSNRRDAIHWGSLVSGVVWLSIVSFFGSFFVRALFSDWASTADWEKVPCLIESANVERRGVDDFVFTAEYSFYWNGRTRHSSGLDSPGETEHRFKHLEERLPLLEKYAPSSSHVCLVAPAGDGAAVLPVESPLGGGGDGPGWGFAVGFGSFVLLAVLAGVWQIAGAFPRMRRLDGGRVKKLAPAVCLLLFGLPFAMVGIGGLRAALAKRALNGEELVAVPAKVLYSGVATHSASRSTTYFARIGYEYVFQGKKYEGDRVGGLGGEFSSSNHRRYRQIADSVKPGDAVKVWVLPSDPRRSALRLANAPDAGIVNFSWAFIFLAAGLVISITGIVLLLRALPRRQIIADGQPRQWVLHRSRAEVVSLGLFAFFWNAIAWTLATVMLPDLLDMRDPILLVAAAFPLIGIGLAVGFAVALRRDLRTPRLTMTLTLPDPTAKPQLDWQLDDPAAVRSLDIRLEGVRSTSNNRRHTAVSLPVAKHDAPVPETWRETFSFPPDPGTADHWRLAVFLRLPFSRRPLRLEFPLLDDAAPH